MAKHILCEMTWILYFRFDCSFVISKFVLSRRSVSSSTFLIFYLISASLWLVIYWYFFRTYKSHSKSYRTWPRWYRWRLRRCKFVSSYIDSNNYYYITWLLRDEPINKCGRNIFGKINQNASGIRRRLEVPRSIRSFVWEPRGRANVD